MKALSELSGPVKFVLALVLVGVVVGLCMLMGISGWTLLVLFLGLLGVLVLMLFFFAILKWRTKRKAAPFERDLAGNTGAVPSNISEASSRARLDDLRQKFLQGIETFKTHGKDIYSVPWYAIVGESGSGKTEALRHSNIGFPPGLQDELQGSGGTINMDWWFTNHAIILDTAGRLMFDESSTEDNPEWIEFLKLLKKHRPNCPINGLMLVVPADSVIRDTADQISDKGGRIARQLDLIQRTLGVRFPVFVLVTKADLINGFREFFDEMSDPQLQHQIMGWSNPNDLDQPFDPEDVVEHIYTVQERLERRRLGLLLDPVSRESAMSRRIDEVDALFAFPESMANLAPRLRRYLELIFVSGEWSSKPLFLRGIYFVSAMREGSALDSDLADVLGLPVEELPEGRMWERDRSYFLRDLFLNKMFRERGLVTRTSNTAGLKKRRGTMLFGTSVVFSLLLILFTWLQYSTLNERIGAPNAFWDKIAQAYTNIPDGEMVIIKGSDTNLTFRGGSNASPGILETLDGEIMTIDQMLTTISKHVEQEIKVPFMFRPVALFLSGGNLLEDERLEAGRAASELTQLRPLVSRAVTNLQGSEWTVHSTAALTELMRLYAQQEPSAPETTTVQLKPLYDLALQSASDSSDDESPLAQAQGDIPELQEAFDILSVKKGWPGSSTLVTPTNLGQVIDEGIDRFIASIDAQNSGQGSGTYASARQIVNALDRFERAEQGLQDNYAPAENGEPRNDLDPWNTNYQELLAGEQGLADLTASLDGATSLADWYDDRERESQESTRATFDAMLQILPPALDDEADDNSDDQSTVQRRLVGFQTKLNLAKTAYEESAEGNRMKRERIELLESKLLALDAEDGTHPYQRRMSMYRQFETLRNSTQNADNLSRLALRQAELAEQIQEQADQVRRMRPRNTQDPVNRNFDAADHLLSLIQIDRTIEITDQTVQNTPLPRSAQEIGKLIVEIVNESPMYKPYSAPTLAMTEWGRNPGTLSPQYHPGAAIAGLNMLSEVMVSLRDRQNRGNDSAELQQKIQDYVNQYIEYWASVVEAENPFIDYRGDWSTFHGELMILDDEDVNDQLSSLADDREQALESLRNVEDYDTWSSRLKSKHENAMSRVSDDLQVLSIDRKDLDQDCFEWFKFWSDRLSGEARAARNTMLQSSIREFNKALKLYPETATDHSIDYWRQLTVIGTDLLAEASELLINTAIQTVDKYDHFPLRRLSSDARLDKLSENSNSNVERCLTWDEVNLARDALNEIRPGIIRGRADESGGFNSGAIGNPGTPINFPGLTDSLIKLRGTELTPAQRTRYDKLAAVFWALPVDPDGNALSCIITYLRPDTSGIDNSCEYMILTQLDATENSQSQRFRIRSVDYMVTEKYPGSRKMIFDFFQNSADMDRGDVFTNLTVNGPWALFAMLHKYKGTLIDKKNNIWEVDVMVDAGNGQSRMRLKLEFGTPIPKLEDWPAPP
ncbi:MAG: hypothetical protein O7G85_11215 [Planctomycetota bacterium]|nr:hypothetical protein [Planctomycetota bacterium]